MFQLILSGLALGCVYSLVALGYHITFMTSRTLNFAQGSAMMLGAVTALILVVDFGWPTPIAMIAAILVLGIFGLALERLAVRPFVRRGSMAWVMSTLAVGIIVENVVLLVFGKSPRGLPNALAQDPVTIAGAGIYPLELLIPVVVLGVALGARLFYGGTMLGRALRATAFDREASLAVGIDVNRMVGLSYATEQHAGGGRRRPDRPADRRQQPHGFPDRVEGVRRRHRRRSRAPRGHSDRQPRVRGHGEPGRRLLRLVGEGDLRLQPGHPRAVRSPDRPVRAHDPAAGIAMSQRAQSWAWVLAAIAAVVVAWFLPAAIGRYYTQMLALAGIYAIVAQGLNLLAGYTGQASLGHAGFYAIGAYTGALLATKLGFGFWSAFPLSILVAAAAGVLIALPSFKLDGPYLAMVTIAFGIIVNSVLNEWSDLTGGTQGVLNIPKPTFAGNRLSLERQFLLIVFMLALTTLLLRNLMHSPWGRAFVAVRENQIAAQAVGLSTRGVKTVAFTISAGLAGAGGHLFAFFQGFISPEAFEFESSIFFLTMVIFGGAGTIAGPLVGAPIMAFLPEMLQRFVDFRLIIYGSMIVAFLYALPHGIVGTLFRRSTAKPLSPASSEAGASPAGCKDSRPAGEPGPSSRWRNAHMAFGGVRALNGIGLMIEPGTIHALIGPNGAGKTVLLNILTGYYRPTEGIVRIRGEDVTGLASHRIARLGIARTFQTAQLFGALTVLQNVLVGFPGQTDWRLLDSALLTPRLRREEASRRAAAGAARLRRLQRRPPCSRKLASVRPPAAGRDRARAGHASAPHRHGRAGGGLQSNGGPGPGRADHPHQRPRHRRAAGGASHGPGDGHLQPHHRAGPRREAGGGDAGRDPGRSARDRGLSRRRGPG